MKILVRYIKYCSLFNGKLIVICQFLWADYFLSEKLTDVYLDANKRYCVKGNLKFHLALLINRHLRYIKIQVIKKNVNISMRVLS